ncbi:YbaB/EbfC family nucleoid-associated protein [Candidatus Gracilibacteria bacterium]|nr:YbaB/EbfC family nucleoid-associated protein [Candidatus Gracilibacteria bacterium]MCF7856060.1 YbaB/EbfC family nucleoid-associated protein [Candidatus Gracilibacteria bacterium]MCF7896385.1 YbaB/EbfC family nucleoid-associated protein [Candidatus Gracilibacteria bacterium]
MDPQITFQQIRQLKLTQDDLRANIFEVQSKGVKVVVNGELKFLEIDLPKKITPEVLKSLKSILNRASKKAQAGNLKAIQKLIK